MNQAVAYEALQHLFEKTADRLAGSLAIVSRQRRLTYGELEVKAARLARILGSLGVSRGTTVAIFTNDRFEIISAILGILKSGSVFCPLDPELPERRLEVMAGIAAPLVFVTERRFRKKLAKITANITTPHYAIVLDEHLAFRSDGATVSLDDVWLSARPGRTFYCTDPDSPCSLYFASGSTGKPRAILGKLKGLDHFVRWEIDALGVDVGTRVGQLAPPSYDGFLNDVFVPLCAGGIVCTPEGRNIALDPENLVDWLNDEQVEVLHCLPPVIRSMLNKGLDSGCFKAMRYVVCAGEPLLPSDVKRWMNVFGDRIKLANMYGPTETTILKLCHFVRPDDVARPSIPIGKPIRGAAVMVVDSQGEPCGVGDVGEIYIRTPYCALGYYGEPELTKEVFIQNPFRDDPKDIVYKTGDYGRFNEDGDVEFLGRRDQQVKVRGMRVELGEIESRLCGYESVRDAAVVASDDGEGNKFLVAYVALKDGGRVERLRQYLSEWLPGEMIPSYFVEMPELPRTPDGKIDRNALPPPEPVETRGRSAADPRNPVEEIVAGIWREVLKVPSVSRTDDFLDLGGHSLLVNQVLSRIRTSLKVKLPVHSLFEAPTVEQLSLLIQQQTSDGDSADLPDISAVPRDGELPLSFSQRRIWYLEQLASGSTAFHMPLGIRLKGPLNLAALEDTLGEIVRRHETLRTLFPALEGQPLQIILRPELVSLPVVDLSDIPEGAREEQARRLAQEEALRGFDLATGPLFRPRLLPMGRQDYIIICTMHHIAGDGQSLKVLSSEMSSLYNSLSQGEPSSVQELTVHYVDYAAWQREWLRGDVLESRLDYWRRRLKDPPPRLNLPQRRERPRVQALRGARQGVAISAGLTEALRQLSRREGLTLLMTMLSGFVLLLNQYAGDEDIVVGTVSANRERVEAENLIGILASPLVLRVDISSAATIRDVMKRVRETCLDAYSFQVPPELLKEDLRVRGIEADGLYDVWFQLEREEREALSLTGLEVAEYLEGIQDSKFELSMVLRESDDGVTGFLEYDDDVFSAATTARMLEEYIVQLERMIAEPDQRI